MPTAGARRAAARSTLPQGAAASLAYLQVLKAYTMPCIECMSNKQAHQYPCTSMVTGPASGPTNIPLACHIQTCTHTPSIYAHTVQLHAAGPPCPAQIPTWSCVGGIVVSLAAFQIPAWTPHPDPHKVGGPCSVLNTRCIPAPGQSPSGAQPHLVGRN